MEQKKILIADDDPLYLKLYSSMLKNSVYNVLQANDGIEALSVARERLPDLIVMDWNMPRMGGLSALKKLKGDDITLKNPN
ncbi:MAG: response regulator [Mariniphaga sp.]|nr:response regulator [Mariniphaga sp.]